jgi:hypothetical protein
MIYIEIGLKIFGLLSLLLILFGTAGNVTAIVICLKDSLSIIPKFVFYVFMLANNILCLYFWNLNHFIETYFGFMIEDFGEWACKSVAVLQLSSLQSTAWLLVAMSIDRYLVSRIVTWRLSDFNSKKALVVSIIIQLIIYLFNSSLLLTVQFDYSSNNTIKAQYYSNYYYSLWSRIHTYSYSIVPFIILGLMNGLLLYETLSRKRILKERVSVTRSVLIMTFSFICFLLPSAIVSGYFLEFLFSSKSGTLVLYILDFITFGYHAFNFLVFSFTNKRFKAELKNLFSKRTNTQAYPTAQSLYEISSKL